MKENGWGATRCRLGTWRRARRGHLWWPTTLIPSLVMRGLTSVGLHLLTGPLTRENRPASQSIKLSALMAAATIYAIISLLGTLRMHLQLTEPSKNRSEGEILALVLIFIMPRARGRPRRGAGWYAADSRRKRHKRFERALVLAKRKRRRETTAVDSPPRTYVEEIRLWNSPTTSLKVECLRFRTIGTPRRALKQKHHRSARERHTVPATLPLRNSPPAW
jgi:hypothetical protein